MRGPWDLSKELKATIAPVGNAWEMAMQADKKLALHEKDKKHPNATGTYLAACVFYARVKGKRREMRRMLAARSKELLARYRCGEPMPEGCPLKIALGNGIFGGRPSGECKALDENSVTS